MDISLLTEDEKNQRIKELKKELKKLQGSMLRSDWHKGFESILRFDTYKYKDQVQIFTEEILGEDPPRTDFVVLIREPGFQMEKSIYKDFREHNILEYKNPHDTLNERVLRKVLGYANLYIYLSQHSRNIEPGQITITIFRSVRNPQMFKRMLRDGRLTVDKVRGIYHVNGYTDLPFRIIITSELEGEEYAAYRALTDRANEEDVKKLIYDTESEQDEEQKRHLQVLLHLVTVKNSDVIRKIRKRGEKMSTEIEEVLRVVFGDEYDEDVRKARAEEHKKTEQETTVNNIKSLMKNTGWTAEESMANLGVSMDQRSLYADLVKK